MQKLRANVPGFIGWISKFFKWVKLKKINGKHNKLMVDNWHTFLHGLDAAAGVVGGLVDLHVLEAELVEQRVGRRQTRQTRANLGDLMFFLIERERETGKQIDRETKLTIAIFALHLVLFNPNVPLLSTLLFLSILPDE